MDAHATGDSHDACKKGPCLPASSLWRPAVGSKKAMMLCFRSRGLGFPAECLWHGYSEQLTIRS